MICLIRAGRAMRATPPSARIMAGTRSRAITAQAPAFSAITACSALVTSMMTPPLSISARPTLRRKDSSMYMFGSWLGDRLRLAASPAGLGIGDLALSYESWDLGERLGGRRGVKCGAKDPAQRFQARADFLRCHSGEADAQRIGLRTRNREVAARKIR